MNYHIFHIVSQTEGFSEKLFEHEMCVLIIPTILFEIFLILGRIQRHIIISTQMFSCKVPVILVGL